MVNDEELCVLFYNRDEEYKKIMESIREEILEDARNGTLQPELLEFFRKRSEEEKIEKAKEIAEEKAKEMAKDMIINMKNSGLSIEKISEYTKLSTQEIENLLR